MAVVETGAIGSGTRIGDFAVIRAGAQLGDAVIIHPHVVIEPGVTIGEGAEVFPGAYIGKEPKGIGVTARLPEFERKVTIGANCSIGSHAVVYYDVSIGENTLIGDGASIREQCILGEKCIVGMHVTVDYIVRIHDRVKVMNHTHIVGKSLIEDNVFIAQHVTMANDRFLGAKGYREADIQGLTIRKGALVGLGSILLPGVEIGEQAVVAAGTVVDRDVPAHKMVIGAPPRLFNRTMFFEPESSSE